MGSSKGGCGSCHLGGSGRPHVHRNGSVSLVCLEAGVLALVVGEPRKVKRLPSLLEGPALFWPRAMV